MGTHSRVVCTQTCGYTLWSGLYTVMQVRTPEWSVHRHVGMHSGVFSTQSCRYAPWNGLYTVMWVLRSPAAVGGEGRGWVDPALVGAESKGGDRTWGWGGVEASKCESDLPPFRAGTLGSSACCTAINHGDSPLVPRPASPPQEWVRGGNL